MFKLLKKIFLLVFILWILGGVAFVSYYFNNHYKWNLDVYVSSPTAFVTVESLKSDFRVKQECIKSCYFSDLIPWDYNIRVSSEGYENVSKIARVIDNETHKVSIEMKETVSLKKIEWASADMKSKTFILNKPFLLSSLAIYSFSWKEYYLRKEGRSLFFWELNLKDKKEFEIWEWSWVSAEIDRVSMTSNEFFVKDDSAKKYIVNVNTKEIFSFNFKNKIDYIKKSSDRQYLLKTENWVFKYSSYTWKIEYLDVFEDFVINWEDYIWYISESSKFSDKYGIEWNFVLSYNSVTKKITKIAPYFKPISRIELIWWEIYIIDVLGDKYTINNIKND